MVATLVLLAATHAFAAARTEEQLARLGEITATRQKEREAEADARMCGPKTCPDHAGTTLFDTDALHLPDHSSAWLQPLAREWVSRVFPIGQGAGDTRFWQARTVTVNRENGEGAVHLLIPFLLAPSRVHVFVGTKTGSHIASLGASDAETLSQQGYCDVVVPLPLGNATCVRVFTPNRYLTTNDPRKNVLGGAPAAAILALDTIVRLRGPGDHGEADDEAIVDAVLGSLNAAPSAADISDAPPFAVDVKEQRRSIRRELALLRAAPSNARFCGDDGTHREGPSEGGVLWAEGRRPTAGCTLPSFPPPLWSIPFFSAPQKQEQRQQLQPVGKRAPVPATTAADNCNETASVVSPPASSAGGPNDDGEY